jgi:hypothetical protein
VMAAVSRWPSGTLPRACGCRNPAGRLPDGSCWEFRGRLRVATMR